MTTPLRTLSLPTVKTLADALAAFRTAVGDPAWRQARALIYTPTACVFDWADDAATALDPAAFEARVFNDDAELRWLRDPVCDQGKGETALLTEDPALGEPFQVQTGETSPVARLERRYLLWGKGTGVSDDRRSCLGTARIGQLRAPLGKVAEEQFVRLRAVEYVTEDDDGNAHILDERLCGLEAYQQDRAGDTQ
jgi:CRISPR-associated protein (TIGR03984 family)